MSNLARLEQYCAVTISGDDTVNAGSPTAASTLSTRCADTLAGDDTVNAAEWLKQPDEKDQPLMDGVFDRGDRVAIVAQSKARKSFLALQLAVCAAAGYDFLGFKLEPQKVLLVNGEVKPTNYKHRLRKLTEALGVAGAQLTSLEFLNSRALNPEGVTLSSILSLCRRHEITTCILDPFYTFIGNEIDQEQVKEAITQMKAFSQHGITLISVFHATKGLIGDRQTIDRISGSGIFARDADALLSLSVHENKTSVVLSFALRNYQEPDSRTIDFDNGAFVDSDLAPVELTSKSRPKREFDLPSVANCISVETTYTEAHRLVSQAMCCGREKAKSLLAQCCEEKLLFKRTAGKNTFYSNGAPVSRTDVAQHRLNRLCRPRNATQPAL